jgi:hypothetical protein
MTLTTGRPLEIALEHANVRLVSKDFELLVTALLIHRKVLLIPVTRK